MVSGQVTIVLYVVSVVDILVRYIGFQLVCVFLFVSSTYFTNFSIQVQGYHGAIGRGERATPRTFKKYIFSENICDLKMNQWNLLFASRRRHSRGLSVHCR